LAVTSVRDKSIGLCWDEPESDGGCDLTQYVVEMREGTRRSWQRAGVSSLADERRYMALALTAGQQYMFRVAAVNRVGVGDWADMTHSVTTKRAHGTLTITRCYHRYYCTVIFVGNKKYVRTKENSLREQGQQDSLSMYSDSRQDVKRTVTS